MMMERSPTVFAEITGDSGVGEGGTGVGGMGVLLGAMVEVGG
jgi:hypothetical protein